MTKVPGVQEGGSPAGAEDRLARAEAALREALEDRARVWEQAQRARALEQDLEQMRRVLSDMQQSPSWRLTAPLRRAKNAVVPRARTAAELARKAQARLRA